MTTFKKDQIPSYYKKKRFSGTEGTDRRGIENEERCFAIACDLLERIKISHPELINMSRCTKSLNFSLRDKHGEDFRIRLETQHPDGRIEKGYIIYDVTGSSIIKINKEDKRKKFFSYVNSPRPRGQDKYARLVRVILVNPTRTNHQIRIEILNDLIECGLLPEAVTF